MRNKEEIVAAIVEQLEEKVTPMVDQHGGVVKFMDFDMDTGMVELMLSGSCSGCAGSSQTLKYGVENLLMHYVPEVKGVMGHHDPMSMSAPYYSHPSFHYPDIDNH
jgi:NFU1 iron-sulfur cluster scaffold homolog, mitochondrial